MPHYVIPVIDVSGIDLNGLLLWLGFSEKLFIIFFNVFFLNLPSTLKLNLISANPTAFSARTVYSPLSDRMHLEMSKEYTELSLSSDITVR